LAEWLHLMSCDRSHTHYLSGPQPEAQPPSSSSLTAIGLGVPSGWPAHDVPLW